MTTQISLIKEPIALGTRVEVTRGSYAGLQGAVTARFGLGLISVRLDGDVVDMTFYDSQLQAVPA